MRRPGTLFLAAALPLLLCGAPGLAQPMALPSSPAEPAPPAALPRISGTWLLAIDSAQLTHSARPAGACSEEIALDLGGTFAAMLTSALQNVFERVETAQLPLTAEEIKRRKAKGVVVVRGDEFRARLLVEPGYVVSHVRAAATLAASVSVEVKFGRAFEAMARGQASAKSDDAGMCQGGAKTLAEVGAAAADDAAKRLATLLAQSPSLRAVQEPQTVGRSQRPRR